MVSSTYISSGLVEATITWLIIVPFIVCCFLDWIQNDKKHVYRFFLHSLSLISSILLGIYAFTSDSFVSEGGLPLTPWIIGVMLIVMSIANIACIIITLIELTTKTQPSFKEA